MDGPSPHRTTRLILRTIGVLLLLAGLFLLILAPLEIVTLSYFAEGGRFEYEGFRVGGLMFGNIIAQIFGYYLLAAVAIPLGYAHLRLYLWARGLAETLLYVWLVLGLPLTIVATAILLASKELPTSAFPALILAFLLLYPVLPLILLRFYRGRAVKEIFSLSGHGRDWTERLPRRVQVTGSLLIFFILALHFPMLFIGIFPLFGRYLFGFQALIALDIAVILLVGLTWGYFGRRMWAWWGAVVYLVFMITSTTITFLTVEPLAIFRGMGLSGLEWEIVQNVPLEGIHLVFLFVLPLVVTLVVLVTTRRQMGAGSQEMDFYGLAPSSESTAVDGAQPGTN